MDGTCTEDLGRIAAARGPEPHSSSCCGALSGVVSKCLVLFRLPGTCCLGLFRGGSGCGDSYHFAHANIRLQFHRLLCGEREMDEKAFPF